MTTPSGMPGQSAPGQYPQPGPCGQPSQPQKKRRRELVAREGWAMAASTSRKTGRWLLAALGAIAALVLGAGPAAAEIVNTRVPLSTEVLSCSGEAATVTGTLQVVTRDSLDPAGGRHVFGHFTFHGQGTGASGTTYVVSLSNTFAHNFPAGGGEAFTNTVPSVVIRQGDSVRDDDGITRVVLHFTINANGDVVANFENGQGDCQ
jgi:hypothetical protein